MIIPPMGMVPYPETDVVLMVVTVMAPNSALSALTLPDTVRAEPAAGVVLIATPPDEPMMN